MAESNREIALQLQSKFQFYAVALVFTILGLSIQTASFDVDIAARICELLSWIFLLVSGLVGLSHLEWNPVLHIAMANKSELEALAGRLREYRNAGYIQAVLSGGNSVPIDERIAEYEERIVNNSDAFKRLDRKAEIKYKVFKWAFVVGIVLLAAARAITPILGILGDLSKAGQ